MAEPSTDPLSQLAHDLIKAAGYGRLTVTDAPPPKAHEMLGGVMPHQLLVLPVVSPPHAAAMLSGLWLWHDDLDACHRIAQKSPTDLGGKESSGDAQSTLAFWHAIMHRREGDFSNSKYWFARCRGHAVLGTMASYANDILHPLPADKSLLRLMRNGWDPDAFVDLVERVNDHPADGRHQAAVALQRIEWRLLFNHCTRLAAGK